MYGKRTSGCVTRGSNLQKKKEKRKRKEPEYIELLTPRAVENYPSYPELVELTRRDPCPNNKHKTGYTLPCINSLML
jgi:hypothetical protein